MRETIQLTGSGSVETVYIFEEKRVMRLKHRSEQYHTAEAGELRTNNITLSYLIRELNGSRCIVLGETYSTYPLRLLLKENEALKDTIFHIADKEKLMVLQSNSKPDYGFEIIKMHMQAAPMHSRQRLSARRLNSV